MSGKPAARVGDMHTCPMSDGPKPHIGGPVLPPGKPTVMIGGMPAATVLDRCFCASIPDVITSGSYSVMINRRPAARQGDSTLHRGKIIVGCPTVLIGDTSNAGLGNALTVLDRAWKRLSNETLDKSEGHTLVRTVQNYEKTEHTLAMARLSQHVYGGDVPLPEGYVSLTEQELSELGIKKDMLVGEASGFKAGIYKNNNALPGEPSYVIAYAGTEDIWKDGLTDLIQGMGLDSTQYNKAVQLAMKMHLETYDRGGVETTGHSLGGGLASAASAVTGVHGTTFNTAGLHRNTASRWGVSSSEYDKRALNVDAFYNSDDPLNFFQNNRGKVITTTSMVLGGVNPTSALAAGLIDSSGALPTAYGNHSEIGMGGHGIGSVISNLEKSQSVNQRIIDGVY